MHLGFLTLRVPLQNGSRGTQGLILLLHYDISGSTEGKLLGGVG
jgi:hypothetical protein